MKVKKIPFSAVTILPPAPGTCQVCAVDHEPEMPHNRDSLYYQMKFYQENGRHPTWRDAMAHCTPEIKSHWMKALAEEGIIIGEVPEQ